ncbi:MAG TPA: L-rhamnose mutarotase [Stenotrophomonas sp.]|nr:L-rhamnose mutarotase [Stenotrophomonas sp.]
MQQLLALDLKDDPALIAEYEAHHRRIWPEIAAALREEGVLEMQIFRLGTRLVMRMLTDDARFDAGRFALRLARDPRSREWEALMDRYQAPTPWSVIGRKWTPMQQIFDLDAQ